MSTSGSGAGAEGSTVTVGVRVEVGLSADAPLAFLTRGDVRFATPPSAGDRILPGALGLNLSDAIVIVDHIEQHVSVPGVADPGTHPETWAVIVATIDTLLEVDVAQESGWHVLRH